MKQKQKVKIICEVLSLTTAVIGAYGGLQYVKNRNINVEENTTSTDTTIINIVGDENMFVQGDNYNDSREITNNYSIVEGASGEGADEVPQAHFYCMNGEYEKARLLYEQDQDWEDEAVLINLGYIYSNRENNTEEDMQKAYEYYQRADCIEAKRNLYVWYWKNALVDDARRLFDYFLDAEDEVFLNYLAYCYDFDSWTDFQDSYTEITADDIWKGLFEWDATYEYQTGMREDIPYDTLEIRWILQNVDYTEGDNTSNPYATYRKYIHRYAKGFEFMERCYSTQDGQLVVLTKQ